MIQSGGKYWPKGTIIQTRCNKGHIFDTNEKRLKAIDSHKCEGGGNGWKNLLNQTDFGSRPGLCPRACKIDP